MKANKEPNDLFTISGADLSNNKMLLIEDDPTCVLLIREIFFGTGIEVLSAMDGANGLKKLRQNPDTNIVLLDIRLPDIDGFMVYDKIKKISPCVPVIAITAGSPMEMTMKCKEAGFYGFMLKPLEIVTLLRMVYFALKFKTN